MSQLEKFKRLTRRKSLSPLYMIACTPKSGSTFAAKFLAHYLGTNTCFAGNIPDRSVQNLDALAIDRCRAKRSSVIHQHVPYHGATQAFITLQGIKPVVLVRNLYDAVVSIRDHLKTEKNGNWPGAHIDVSMLSRSDEEIEIAISHVILPWYFTFYAGWKETNYPVLTYREIVKDPSLIISSLGLAVDGGKLENSLIAVRVLGTRKNVGVHGRGENIATEARDHIGRLARHYSHIDLGPLLD